MRYEKALAQGSLFPSAVQDWGTFTLYLEIGEDDFAVRDVREFQNGCYLRYDRTHWCDDFGILSDAPIPDLGAPSEWTVVAVDVTEFERAWKNAGRSPDCKAQAETAQMKRLGGMPPWLQLRNS